MTEITRGILTSATSRPTSVLKHCKMDRFQCFTDFDHFWQNLLHLKLIRVMFWSAEIAKGCSLHNCTFLLHIAFYTTSQCRTTVLHCCKDDAASQWEMAILGVSELCNPWTDRLKIWHTWLRRWVDLVCQIS